MNILFNNYCNLDCEYCFANDVISEDSRELSKDNLEYILQFLKNSKKSSARVIGGEPTLHPNFQDMMLLIAQKKWIEHILLFTNGSYKHEYNFLMNLLNKELKGGFNLLLNLNHPDEVGQVKYRNTIRNIKKLKEYNVKIKLSMNFYRKDQDYQYLLNIADKYDINSIRYTITVPRVTENVDIKKYYKSKMPNIIEFIKDANELNISTSTDCNNIPLCLLDNYQHNILSASLGDKTKGITCGTVIDIKPNLDVIRCFALSEFDIEDKNLKDFNNVDDIEKYFEKNINKPIMSKELFEGECKQCDVYKLNNNKSCGCLKFKI